MLKVEVVDENCEEGEAHIHIFPLEVSKVELIMAIELFYPTATSIYMAVEEEEEGI